MANVNRTDINTSARFASIMTDGSGSGVFARVTSPALVTPTIAGATITGTVTIGNGATLTTPIVNGALGTRSIETVTTTNVITAAESGKTFYLGSATGFVSTLPLHAAGLWFKFIINATPPTSGNHTVIPNATDDNTMEGNVIVNGANVPGITEGSINFVASTAVHGDYVIVESDGTNWVVSGVGRAAGSITLTT